jgi:hypothetical protein
MKKLLLLFSFCLVFLTGQAQIPVVDGLSNKQLLDEIVKWVQDYARQHGQQIGLEKVFAENKTTAGQITALLQLKQQIEKGLYSTDEFKKLRISDLSRIIDEVYRMGSIADYGRDLPVISEFGGLLERPSTIENAGQLYNYLFEGTSVYQPEGSGRLDGYLNRAKEQKAKAYAIHVATQKRKMAAAMTYKRLAEQFTQLAGDLSARVNTEGAHRMTTGERIKAQKMAGDYLVKSLEMKQKADQLVKEAMQKAPVVEQIDQSGQFYLNRRALGQIPVY